MMQFERLIARLRNHFLSFDGTRDLGRGTAFPLSADLPGGLQSGDRFFRTDLGFACFYDGTRWLTVHEYCAPLVPGVGSPAFYTTANTGDRRALLHSAYAPFFTRGSVELLTGPTNNGANYFTFAFSAGGTTIWSFTTAADAANAVVTKTTTTFTQPASATKVQLVLTVTGAPGATYPNEPVVFYRLVIS